MMNDLEERARKAKEWAESQAGIDALNKIAEDSYIAYKEINKANIISLDSLKKPMTF